MSTAKNLASITGNLVADPEVISPKVIKFRIAVSRAGSNREDKEDNTGFFNITYFVNDGSPNGKFVSNQISNGNMKKGSGIAVVGELRQERWSKDGKNASTVVVIADNIDYATSAAKPQDAATGDSDVPLKTQTVGSEANATGDEIAFKF